MEPVEETGYEGCGGNEKNEEGMSYERLEAGLELGGGEVLPFLMTACDGLFLSRPQSLDHSRIAEQGWDGDGGRQRKGGCGRRATGQDKNSTRMAANGSE